MSYEVLARRLRPAGFDALIGQDHVVKALRHALNEDRVHHAYLFTGTRGVGKTTIARIVAKALNCEEGVSAEPCGVCGACTAIRDNRFIDLIEVDAASRTGVDDTRELLENAQYLPSQGRYKVYLIDEVHMLTINSFNALLKTLEEPPEHVKFLLATTDPKKVPATVLSRCLQFQLKNLSAADIGDYLGGVLKDESVEYEPAALEVIARAAAGSMRDALSLTDQAIAHGEGRLTADNVAGMLGVAGRDEVGALLAAIASGSARQVLEVTADLAARGTDFVDLLKQLMTQLHGLAVALALEEDAGEFSAEEVQLYYQISLTGYRDIQHAPDERSGLEMTVLRMLAFAPQPDSGVPRRAATESEGSDTPDAPPEQNTSSGAEPVEAEPAEAEPAEQPSPGHGEIHAPADPVATRSPGQGPSSWYSVVEGLEVAGVTRMIAEHSELVELALPLVSIRLDQAHDTLLNETQRTNLERALGQSFGQEVKLNISTGTVTIETPAQRIERLTLERQAQAEQDIRQDVNVQSLLSEFDGRVDDVRPV